MQPGSQAHSSLMERCFTPPDTPRCYTRNTLPCPSVTTPDLCLFLCLVLKTSLSANNSAGRTQKEKARRRRTAAVLLRGKRAALHRSSPVCPGATPTSGSSLQNYTKIHPKTPHSDHIKTYNGLGCQSWGAKTPVSILQTALLLLLLPPLPSGGPERAAGRICLLARTQRLSPRREVSAGPAYAPRRGPPPSPTTTTLTPGYEIPSILTGDWIHPAPDRVCSPPGPPPCPCLIYLASFFCSFSVSSSSRVHSRRHFLLSPKDPGRETGALC